MFIPVVLLVFRASDICASFMAHSCVQRSRSDFFGGGLVNIFESANKLIALFENRSNFHEIQYSSDLPYGFEI